MRLYGLTPSQYGAMYGQQEGRCAVCADVLIKGAKGTHVDHCHDTGVVRGLVCFVCNTGMGKFRDDPNRLRKAAEYLEVRRSA